MYFPSRYPYNMYSLFLCFKFHVLNISLLNKCNIQTYTIQLANRY